MKQVSLKLLAVIAVLFALFTLRQSLMAPPAGDPDHIFDTEAAYARLVNILGDEAPHPVDSDANDAVRQRLLTEIKALGFTPIVRDDFHCSEGGNRATCARVQNVMFWVGDAPAENAPADAVMIASHYDSVPTGPGAADDGAGVAASLEIARILKSRALVSGKLPKAVLVMITDGEEIGLIGASSFVKKDPLARYIGAVISLEARGVSGPVALIETSTPNSRDIDILGSDIQKPVTSSLAADLYAAMPNGTDVTEYLALDIDVGNFAIGSGAAFYHTPRDNLAMLDKRSLFHMGATALSGVETFLAADKAAPESQKIYMDIWGRFVIVLPQITALFVLVIGGFITAVAFIRAGKAHRWKALLYPPIALVVGVGIAFGLSWGLNAIRPEAHFAAAHPWALRGLQNIAALLGALIIYKYLARPAAKAALIASGWLWMCVLLGAAFILPGATILFVPALMIASVGLLAQILGKSPIASVIIFIAAALFVAVGVQISALGEIMLFAEAAAPFTLFIILGFILLAPLTLPDTAHDSDIAHNPDAAHHNGATRPVIIGAALTTLALTIAAALVPAYSVDAPRGLSVEHVHVKNDKFEYRVRGTDPLPASMNAVAPFDIGPSRQTAKAPPLDDFDLTINTVQSYGDIALSIISPKADALTLQLDYATGMSNKVTMNGVPLFRQGGKMSPMTLDKKPSVFYLNCVGRKCRDMQVTLPKRDDSKVIIYAYQYGLGTESHALLDARPDWALPQHRGDRRRVSRTVTLGPTEPSIAP